jgi:hypothetical protein
MTAYQNCEVSEDMPVTLPSGVLGRAYGFSIRSENKGPLVTLSFGMREHAEQARAEIARAVEKVVEVTRQAWADRGAGCAARPLRWRKKEGTGG